MTEANESNVITTAANKGVKQGLPQDGLPLAASNAVALWEVARLGTTSKAAYADKLGRKGASGGGWDRLVAVLRGFGLIRVAGDQIGLSELGQHLVNGSDPVEQVAARRTAMLHLKAYKDLITSFDGTSIPEKGALASKLKFEYGKSDEFAAKAAQAFIESLAYAEMVDHSGVLRKNGADAAIEPMATDDQSEDQAELIDDAFEAEDEPEHDELTQRSGADVLNLPRESEPTIGSAQVSISVTLDLARYRADEVIDILRVLKG